MTNPFMLTTDLSLRMDPIYEPIARRFLETSIARTVETQPGANERTCSA
jgi:catalase (peroxidase I)